MLYAILQYLYEVIKVCYTVNIVSKIEKLSPQDERFPKKLLVIHTPPKQLFLCGKLPAPDQVMVAIVGSRAVTNYGKAVTYKLAYELARSGVGIISGLALGIDAIAHQAALDADGYTLAIQANGLDRIYPARNQPIGREILNNGGGVISECEPGTPPQKFRFPARNRLIAGLCDALIVTEAVQGSGSLITAQFALDENKTVLAVPGNITSAQSAGTNNLIKLGATPITRIEDVFTALELKHRPTSVPRGDNAQQEAVISAIAKGLEDQDEIAQQSGLESSLFFQTLTILEINGKIRSLGGGKWTLS